MEFDRADNGVESRLTIRGELDALTAPELRPAIDALVEQKRKSIVVDVTGLDLIDSSGVAVLVSLYKRTRAHGGRMVVIGAKNQPLAVFKLLRIDRVFLKGDEASSKATGSSG
jgi:anti-sigma B factor antagonist